MTTATLLPPSLVDRAEPRDQIGRRYGRMWARVPRELGYLALTAVIGLVVSSAAAGASRTGGMAFTVVGFLVLVGLLLVSRTLGRFDLRRLRWARTATIAAPSWNRPFAGKRPLRALGDVIADGHSWLYALHCVVVSPLLALLTSFVWFGWLLTAVGFTTFPAWGLPPVFDGYVDPRTHPTTSAILVGNSSLAQLLIRAMEGGRGAIDPVRTGWVVAGVTALGLLLLALLPFVTRGATLAHWGAARLLLARFPSEDLRTDVARVDAARLAAVTAEDTALRRLERDIHDGPQQRLLRIQMELATAERRLGDSPGAAESIATARLLTTETLDELRALAQGFAPPLLQDRGLSAALGALGRRGEVPVEAAIAITGGIPDAVERSVYFIAAELVANAIKHADASRIRLDARADDTPGGRMLRLRVTDDGRGGAHAVPGHGLAGAEERLAGLGGTMTVTSPVDGPTDVDVQVPLP